jgi:Nucleotidyl transferase AbiEii toxin, Type IV TA system
VVNTSDSWLDQPNLRLSALLRRLHDGGVDFVVIGGVAVIMQGASRFTKDLDICYSTDKENLDRLGSVLISLGARLRGVEEDVPFIPDGRTLRHTQILTLTTPDGNLDLLVRPDGSPSYTVLRARASRVDLDGVVVSIASVDDMIAMKRASARPQDLVDLESLEIARRRRRSSSRP